MSGSSMRKGIHRRTMLRGLGGVMIGLPILEAMQPRLARAATPPKRFIVSYCGTLHGNEINPAVGPLPATMPAGSKALEPVRSLVSMVSGMTVPTYLSGQTPPPGGRYNMQHGGIMAPLLSGNHSVEIMQIQANGHTVDQVVADAVGAGTFLSSVQARIQTAGYGGGDAKGICSARIDGGTLRALAPIASPNLLFSTLFGSLPSPSGSSGPTVSQRKRKSVLDFILGDADRLSSQVSAADRVRLDQHFTEIRSLEQRLTPPVISTGSCVAPAAPTDPALGATTSFGGWSDETTRGDLMADLIALALSCDLTRSVSLMFSYDQSFLMTQDPTAAQPDMHATGHQGTQDQIAANANWHCGRFARLVQALAGKTEGAGTLLDSTVAVMVFAEGVASHNSSIMTGLIAGIPSKLKMGQHIASAGAHPAQVMVSAMQAMGLSQNSLGEISGPFAPVLV